MPNQNLTLILELGRRFLCIKSRPIHVHYNLASLFLTKSRIEEDLVRFQYRIGLQTFLLGIATAEVDPVSMRVHTANM